jgi:SAM-dependent methyltransferase
MASDVSTSASAPSPSLDLHRPFRSRLHLLSAPGVVERLLQQCHDIGAPRMTGIRRTPDSVVLDFDGTLADLMPLRMFSTLSAVLDENAVLDEGAGPDPVEALAASTRTGLLATLDRAPAFRVDPVAGRAELLAAVPERLGWTNSPRAWDVNLAEHDGLLLAQFGPMHRSSRYPRLHRIPASVNPVVGSLLLQLLKPAPGDSVLDPFCGSGTLLTEAAALGHTGPLLGGDSSLEALRTAQQNVDGTAVLLWHGRAEHLPLADGSVGRVVSNMPFGKRVGSHDVNTRLYPAFLAELTRVLRPDGRAVLLTEDKKLLTQAVQRTPRIRVIKEAQVSSGGLHPTAYTIEHTQASRRNDRRRGRRG